LEAVDGGTNRSQLPLGCWTVVRDIPALSSWGIGRKEAVVAGVVLLDHVLGSETAVQSKRGEMDYNVYNDRGACYSERRILGYLSLVSTVCVLVNFIVHSNAIVV
jgi:hypothetical protein